MHGRISKILHSTKQFNSPCYIYIYIYIYICVLFVVVVLFMLIRSHTLLNVITVIGE